jgi:hypothetical protein
MFTVGNDAVNALLYMGNFAMMPANTLFISLQPDEFHGRIDNLDHNFQQLYEMAGIFKGLSQDAGRGDFYKNLLASLFNKYGTYRMNLNSAGSNALEGTFNFPDLLIPG